MFANKGAIFQNNPEKSYTERKAKHEPSGYSLGLIYSFDSTKNLKELGTEIINCEKKDMIPLTDEEIKFYEKQKQCNICKKGLFKVKRMNLNT